MNNPTKRQILHARVVQTIMRNIRMAAETQEVAENIQEGIDGALTELELSAKHEAEVNEENAFAAVFHAPPHQHVYYPIPTYDRHRMCIHCDGVWYWSDGRCAWVLQNKQQGER